MAVAKVVDKFCRITEGYPTKDWAPGPSLLSWVAIRWVAPIPSAADGTRNAASTTADSPTIDFGLKRMALTAPSRMSANCSGRRGTMPGLWAVSIGIGAFGAARE